MENSNKKITLEITSAQAFLLVHALTSSIIKSEMYCDFLKNSESSGKRVSHDLKLEAISRDILVDLHSKVSEAVRPMLEPIIGKEAFEDFDEDDDDNSADC